MVFIVNVRLFSGILHDSTTKSLAENVKVAIENVSTPTNKVIATKISTGHYQNLSGKFPSNMLKLLS